MTTFIWVFIKCYWFFRDLLVPNDKMATSNALSLKETPTEGVTVPGKYHKINFNEVLIK